MRVVGAHLLDLVSMLKIWILSVVRGHWRILQIIFYLNTICQHIVEHSVLIPIKCPIGGFSAGRLTLLALLSKASQLAPQRTGWRLVRVDVGHSAGGTAADVLGEGGGSGNTGGVERGECGKTSTLR